MTDNTLERKGRRFFYFSTKFLRGKQKKEGTFKGLKEILGGLKEKNLIIREFLRV